MRRVQPAPTPGPVSSRGIVRALVAGAAVLIGGVVGQRACVPAPHAQDPPAAPSSLSAAIDATEPARRARSAVRPPAPGAASIAPAASAVLVSRDRARADRDRVRRQIYAAWGQVPPEDRPTAAPAASDAPALDRKYLQDRIREDFAPLARSCYEDALVRVPRLAGKVVLDFTIVGDEAVGGVVESAELGDGGTLHDAEFGNCIRESLLSVTFKAPEHGGRVTVTYPFDFSPGEPDP